MVFLIRCRVVNALMGQATTDSETIGLEPTATNGRRAL